mgnify:CR=1 FL=1
MNQINNTIPDLLVIGSGPSGMMGAIAAAAKGAKVTILEQMKKPGMKLLATGGRRCNLTNTKSPEAIMSDFGRNGRFMAPALALFDNSLLRDFFHQLGVPTHSPDGFRVWPKTHRATSIHSALLKHAEELGISIICDCEVKEVLVDNQKVLGVNTTRGTFSARTVLLATGGLSLASTGSTGSGYILAKNIGHKIKPTFPSGVPLFAKESWTAKCTADTIPRVKAKVNINSATELNDGKPMKGVKGIQATGDLIFSRKGIAGPLALNLSRELAPVLAKYPEVPIELNLVHGQSEGTVYESLINQKNLKPKDYLDQALSAFAPPSLREVLLHQLEFDKSQLIAETGNKQLLAAAQFLTKTPLTIYDTAGYVRAIATKGGVDLKGINPKTLMSKQIENLFFSGELVDMDGPCGGYNLTWAFTSGRLAGTRAYEATQDL